MNRFERTKILTSTTSLSTKRQRTHNSGDAAVVIEIRKPSHLTLIMGDGKDTEQIHYKVNRAALRLISPVWNAMFDTDKPYQEASSNEVAFPEDHPEALGVLLRAAHFRFNDLPNELTVPQVNELAIVCDKYNSTEAISRFLAPVLDKVFSESSEDVNRVKDIVSAA